MQASSKLNFAPSPFYRHFYILLIADDSPESSIFQGRRYRDHLIRTLPPISAINVIHCKVIYTASCYISCYLEVHFCYSISTKRNELACYYFATLDLCTRNKNLFKLKVICIYSAFPYMVIVAFRRLIPYCPSSVSDLLKLKEWYQFQD